MKNAMNWIKANPLTVGAAVVVVIALVYCAVFFAGQKADFITEVDGQAKKTPQLEGMRRTSVTVRPIAQGDEPVVSNVVVNEPAIDALKKYYGRIDEASKAAQAYLLERNQLFHDELTPGILPGPKTDNTRTDMFRQGYRAAFYDMLGPAQGDEQWPARLNAGSPPTSIEVQERMDAIANDYGMPLLDRVGGNDPDSLRLAEERSAELEATQRENFMQMLQAAAQQIHIYVDPLPERGDPAEMVALPFTIEPWNADTVQLAAITIENIWDGQTSLWIQEDIVRAIALANDVTNPDVNVLNSPIKRLIKIEVMPDYLGAKPRPGATGGSRPVMPGGFAPGYGMDPAMGPYPGDPYGGMPGYGGASGDATAEEPLDPNQPIKPDFTVSPTGRRSNPLYDVRVARVTMVIDSARLPEIFRAFHSVNFMTVVDVQMTDVNEEEALKDGFIYSGDAVEVTFTIESVWLREWTAPMMPKSIRLWLGIDKPEDGSAAATGDD